MITLRSRMIWPITLVIGIVVAAYALVVYVRFADILHKQLDTTLQRDYELASQSLSYRQGRWQWKEVQHPPWVNGFVGQRIEVWSPDGRRAYLRHVTPELERLDLPPPVDASNRYQTFEHSDWHVRAYTGIFLAEDDGRKIPYTLRVVRIDAAVSNELAELLGQLLAWYPIAIAFAGLGAWWLSGRLLLPINKLSGAAEAITVGTLDQRLPVERDDEVGRLARAFNQTLGRLELAFEQLTQFSADVAHELRTPLTALRNQGELALRNPSASMDADTRRMLIAMLEESSRLGRMIDRLLLIARADQTRMTPSLVPRTLAPIAEDSISLMQVLAEENNLHLGLEGDLTRQASVDEDCMRQVLIDLLDNALRYAHSRVVIRIVGEGGCTRVDVDDDGPGIPEEKRSRMLQRFARDDESRTRTPLQADGFGLGLAIASALTELQKGTLELADASSADGSVRRGLSVRLRFPATGQA